MSTYLYVNPLDWMSSSNSKSQSKPKTGGSSGSGYSYAPSNSRTSTDLITGSTILPTTQTSYGEPRFSDRRSSTRLMN